MKSPAQTRQHTLPGLDPVPARIAASADPLLPRARPGPDTLWLALHFPHLALDLIAREGMAPVPLVVCNTPRGRPEVHAASRAARRAGIRPGMPLGAALGLCADLRVRQRDAAAEHAALETLAAWGLQYTDHVVVEDGHVLLLEVGRSLRLFGGLEHLRRRILDDLAALGHHARAGLAVTPLGARLLARLGITAPARDTDALTALIRELPVEALEWPAATVQRLRGMGVTRLGALWRLPRDGLARRLGAWLPVHLDRLTGRRPDPRPRFAPPPRFESRLWLPAEMADRSMLRLPLHRLLRELAGVLRGRGAAVQSLVLQLLHARHPATALTLGLAAPGRDPDHLLGLCMERLSRQVPAAAVTGMVLRADIFLPLPHRDTALLPDAGTDTDAWQALLDRLRARLGRAAVWSLAVCDDHRPERAWRRTDPADSAPGGVSPPQYGPRPLWLLEHPLPCPPSLRRVHGPERIETGWWDGAGERRDYYIAEDRYGVRWWLYREHGTDSVCLCGVFG
ncbi:Y-family DNA polymerase [Thioalkalivibrio thiocyanodenitrificans]|uniref:Y-family DNA polymerase n=1 Tax=Thioalkalivibrio thiocyanodenitrificans TaxID=243063 RepID=UPI000381A5E2|nr:DNA polymerase Y family protein [Thioalkalivibrio thiocyanodenitrificans]